MFMLLFFDHGVHHFHELMEFGLEIDQEHGEATRRIGGDFLIGDYILLGKSSLDWLLGGPHVTLHVSL